MKSIAKLLISLAICFTCDPLHVSAQENIPDEGDTTTETPSPEKIEEQWAEELIYRANTVQLSADKSTLRYPVMEQKRVSTTGTWTWRDGVICVTDSYASVDWFNNGHAGIVAAAPYYRATIEANPNVGVQVRYGDWASRFPNKNVWQAGVHATTVQQDHDAAVWAATQLGKPYKFPTTLGNRDAYYCSHLVYAAYKDTSGVNLDTIKWPGFIHPFELLDTSNVSIVYRRNAI